MKTPERLKKNREWMATDRLNNPEKHKARERAWARANRDKARKRSKDWGKNPDNAERKRAYNAERYRRKKEEIKLKARLYMRSRLASDPVFRFESSAKLRIRLFLKRRGFRKEMGSYQMIGCSPQELRMHIESLFTDGMNWSNYGRSGWHIDHIIPLSSASSKEDVIKLCHYTNLQPLWAIDNIRKSNHQCYTTNSSKPSSNPTPPSSCRCNPATATCCT